MSTNFESVHVKCPFYLNEDSLYISCQGVLEGSHIQKHLFKDKKAKDEHKKQFCNSLDCFKNCKICKLINAVEYSDLIKSRY
jgi:hypothetical protein|nr:MAG TPA: hypothetical protein [Caudoviricetes sp.]